MATSAPIPSRSDAKRLVDEFNKNHKTPAWRRAAGHAVHNDAPFGQVDAHLIVLGYDTSAYRSGAVAYLTEMARTGNHVAAMRAASKAAGIEAPAEDRGPVDRAVDHARERRTAPPTDTRLTDERPPTVVDNSNVGWKTKLRNFLMQAR